VREFARSSNAGDYDGSDSRYYPLTDAIGLKALTDSTGAVVNRYNRAQLRGVPSSSRSA